MAKLTMYAYPQCGTCRKARKYLDEHDVRYDVVHIVEQPPSKTELKQWLNNSELPIKKFFNTSGQLYRELGMKHKINELNENELLQLLAENGKLIKRPIVTDGEKVTVGFKEDEFRDYWVNE